MKSQASKVLLRGTLGADVLYRFSNLKVNSDDSSLKNHSFNNQKYISVANNNVVSNLDHVDTFTTWHRRLGHAHTDVVRTMLSICNINSQGKHVAGFCNA